MAEPVRCFAWDSAGVVTTMHAFDGVTGAFPAGFVQVADGNLYGTTFGGGGTIFRMSLTGAVTILHSFDGDLSPSGLIEADWAFYGTTPLGAAPPVQA